MVRASNSPLLGEAGCLVKRSVLSFHHGMTRARLHDRPAQLRVRPVLAQHQVQPHRQFACHRRFGQSAMFAHGQATIEASQLHVARRHLARFHQQKTQKRTALLADPPQLLAVRRCCARWESARSSWLLACPKRTARLVPASAPWPTPSPARLAASSSALKGFPPRRSTP